jgi:cobalt/nickel transport system ATP-binding protein
MSPDHGKGAAIAASGLWYRYPDGRLAVEDVSFTLEEGESLGIIGPNGAGKTTLLHLLAGLCTPERGEVLLLGKKLDEKNHSDLRRHLGIVFQETEDQLFSPTVFDDVAFGPLNFGLPLEEVRRRVAEALGQVGLSGYESRVPHHLSSGERRRAALATVLSYGPEILVLDEPSSDLDPRGRRELVKLLRATRQARLVASHDFEFILRTCERVLLLEKGRVRADGRAMDLLCDGDLLARHGLDVPLGLKGMKSEDLKGILEREEPGL